MEILLARCSSVFSEHGSLLAVFLLGGLTGGFTHCLAMCGPVVACQSACGNCNKTNAAQLPYHLGRFVTYGALGFFAALLGKQIEAAAWWPVLSSVMLAVAGVMFLVSSLPGCKHALFQPNGKSSLARGLLMGFMPCGLLYAALMMAATLANPLAGLFAMWLFVLGTIPALLFASVGANLFSKKWQPGMQMLGRAVMAFNGLSLLVMAEKIVR